MMWALAAARARSDVSAVSVPVVSPPISLARR
jgi:hypothetical protein